MPYGTRYAALAESWPIQTEIPQYNPGGGTRRRGSICA
jgi:hypothetical protein